MKNISAVDLSHILAVLFDITSLFNRLWTVS